MNELKRAYKAFGVAAQIAMGGNEDDVHLFAIRAGYRNTADPDAWLAVQNVDMGVYLAGKGWIILALDDSPDRLSSENEALDGVASFGWLVALHGGPPGSFRLTWSVHSGPNQTNDDVTTAVLGTYK